MIIKAVFFFSFQLHFVNILILWRMLAIVADHSAHLHCENCWDLTAWQLIYYFLNIWQYFSWECETKCEVNIIKLSKLFMQVWCICFLFVLDKTRLDREFWRNCYIPTLQFKSLGLVLNKSLMFTKSIYSIKKYSKVVLYCQNNSSIF